MPTVQTVLSRKRMAKGLEVLRQLPWALAVSATLSLIFVVFVAALIAFMQYQTRLLRSQPGLTASQLVYYVDTEKKIQQEQFELGKYSEAISQSTPAYTLASTEINFRIERICALFDKGRDASADTDKCRQFLYRIPFEGTAKNADLRLTNMSDSKNTTTGSPSSVEPISAELLNSIMANFIEVIGPRTFGDVEFAKLASLFRSDLGIIARLNQDYWLHIRPKFFTLLTSYAATCQHLIQLIKIVSSYRTIVDDCNQSIADKFSEGQVVEGGAILPARATDNQPGAAQAQAVVGETADQAVNLGQAPSSSDVKTGVPQPATAVPSGGTPANIASAQRTFELVTHYRFYDRISFGKLRDILISPNDFLALVLVCVGGILGALLRIVFSSYISGKDPTLRSIVISPILGLICSLVIYNLFRAGFIVITDQPQNSDTTTLSPFVIALLAMAAGLLSERTIGFFRKTFDNWLGSVEASEAARWAVNLQREMETQRTTAEKLAERLDISATKLNDWAQEKEPVPSDKQREIALALNVPVRRIFTDLEPTRTG